MAGAGSKRKPTDGKLQRLSKKQKRSQQYDSGSEDEDGQDFAAVDLMDSDDDIHNAEADDAAPSDDGSVSSEDDGAKKLRKKISKRNASEAQDDAGSDSEPNDDDDDATDDSGSDDDGANQDKAKNRSKRNDPNAFATSLSKILSTKLSTSKRSDPVLARSAAAHEASKAAVDSALETKARKQIRDEKRRAMERGRVKDVLIASTRNEQTGEPETTTAEILETERRLRKVAQRGVVKLFNAVRAAQVKATEAERSTRKDGVVGVTRREEKVNEMSKKGFLELIASGGGGLKKGALEEA